jgi:hypothetical protein
VDGSPLARELLNASAGPVGARAMMLDTDKHMGEVFRATLVNCQFIGAPSAVVETTYVTLMNEAASRPIAKFDMRSFELTRPEP